MTIEKLEKTNLKKKKYLFYFFRYDFQILDRIKFVIKSILQSSLWIWLTISYLLIYDYCFFIA